MAKVLLGAGADANAKAVYGWTPLHAASGNGHHRVLEILLEANADITASLSEDTDFGLPDAAGSTPLHVASSSGRSRIVQRLIVSGADIDATTQYGWTALHCASAAGHSLIVKRLIDAGASVHAEALDAYPPDSGLFLSSCGLWTALYCASAGGHDGVVRRLLRAGANPNVRTYEGILPLHEASVRGHLSVVRSLLEAGAYVDAGITNDSRTSLFLAADISPLEVSADILGELGNKYEVADFLLRSGADPRSLEPIFSDVLFGAFRFPRLIRQVLEAGADPQSVARDGRTALCVAMMNESDESAVQLLEFGAQFNGVPDETSGLLTTACKLGLATAVTYLLRQGADPDAVSDYKQSALHLACDGGHAPIAKHLIGAGADPNPLTADGETPLLLAAGCGHEEVVTVLLSSGADPNISASNGNTPLHVASNTGNAQIVATLLRASAEPNAMRDCGSTPLHNSVSGGHLEVTQMLLDTGANPSAFAQTVGSPLHVASSIGRTDLIKCLLDAGSDASMTNKDGLTAVGCAAQNGHRDAARLLRTNCGSLRSEDQLFVAVLDRDHDAVWSMLSDNQVDPEKNHRLQDFAVATGDIPLLTLLLKADQQDGVPDYTPLHDAASRGDVASLKVFVQAGADLEHICDCGITPLGYALSCHETGYARPAAARLLLESGADPTYPEPGMLQPEHDPSPRKPQPSSQSLLLVVAGQGDVALYRDLEARGAEADRDWLLHYAVLGENGDLIREALSLGCSPAKRDTYGMTPLHWHCTYCIGSAETIELLQAAGADVSAKDDAGQAPLHQVFIDTGLLSEEEWDLVLEQVEVLLECGANVNAVDEQGDTPLHRAARWAPRRVLERLLDAGAQRSVKNDQGQTPLDAATGRPSSEAIQSVRDFIGRHLDRGTSWPHD